MASTQLGTATWNDMFDHRRGLVLAGSRLYAAWNDNVNLFYQYSDDGGASWSGKTTIRADASGRASAFYDSVNDRVNFVYAGGDTFDFALRMRAITSNVTSGVPGALTTETVIDAGGTNLGVSRPYSFHTATASNPRYWICGTKVTAASTFESRAWYANAGTAADTAGNWSTTNFTNLGGNSDANSDKHCIGVWWTVGGADKVTLVFQEGTASIAQETVTFDPTAATPTPGSVVDVTGSEAAGIPTAFSEGALMAIAAKADYLVYGVGDSTPGTWKFFKTVNGTTWTTPSGWTGLTMGRAQLTRSGGDFYLAYANAWGTYATNAFPLKIRKITTSSDTMGAEEAFSDTNGNPINLPIDTGTSTLYAVYRGSTASPYTVRSDVVSIAGTSVAWLTA